MKNRVIGLVSAFLGLVLLFPAYSEPTVTASGSTQVTQTMSTHTKSSFQTQMILNLDINLTDNLNVVLQSEGVTSKGNSSLGLSQGFIALGGASALALKPSSKDQPITSKDIELDKKITEKIYSFPKKNEERDSLRDTLKLTLKDSAPLLSNADYRIITYYLTWVNLSSQLPIKYNKIYRNIPNPYKSEYDFLERYNQRDTIPKPNFHNSNITNVYIGNVELPVSITFGRWDNVISNQ